MCTYRTSDGIATCQYARRPSRRDMPSRNLTPLPAMVPDSEPRDENRGENSRRRIPRTIPHQHCIALTTNLRSRSCPRTCKLPGRLTEINGTSSTASAPRRVEAARFCRRAIEFQYAGHGTVCIRWYELGSRAVLSAWQHAMYDS